MAASGPLLKLVPISAEILTAMPLLAYTANGRVIPLARVGSPVRRFWLRSKAEKMAAAAAERFVVVADDELPPWSVCELKPG